MSVTSGQRNGGIASIHAHLGIEALYLDVQGCEIQLGTIERQVVVAVVEGERVLGGGADVVPARAELRASGEVGRLLRDRDAGGEHGPALVEQRNAAGREARGGHDFDGVRLGAVHDAGGGDGEEVVIDDVEEVARGEAVGGVEDVGLAPADELLAGFDGELAARVGGAEAADGEGGALGRAVPPGQAEVALGFEVGIGAEVDAAGEVEIGRQLVEGFVAEEGFGGGVAAVVGRGLGKSRPVVSRKPRWVKSWASAAQAATAAGRNSQAFHWSRRRAWTVKSSSFMGTLYSSF